MHVRTCNDLIQTSNVRLSYIFYSKSPRRNGLLFATSFLIPNFPQVEEFYRFWSVWSFTGSGLSHLHQLDHPFSSHQHCFGSKLSSQMGAVVHQRTGKMQTGLSTSQINLLLWDPPETWMWHSKVVSFIEKHFWNFFFSSGTLETWLIIHSNLSLCEHRIHSNIGVWCFKLLEGSISLLSFTLCSVVSYCMELKWQREMFWLKPNFLALLCDLFFLQDRRMQGKRGQAERMKSCSGYILLGRAQHWSVAVSGVFLSKPRLKNSAVTQFQLSLGILQALTAAHKHTENMILKCRTHEGTGKPLLPLLNQCAGILILTSRLCALETSHRISKESCNTVQFYDDHKPHWNISISKDFH